MTTDRTDPALPSPAAWKRLGLDVGEELTGGFQSRVFTALLGRSRVVVKLVDADAVDRSMFETRLEVLVDLAGLDADVVGPIEIGGALHHRIGGWLAVVSADVGRKSPDIGRRDHVTVMGASLASLHRSMARLGGRELPVVAALCSMAPAGPAAQEGGWQLIHGDFAASNLRLVGGGVRVFDFADCGYGSVEFEVGNSLYMVLFDATVHGAPDRYRRFRRRFVDAYADASGAALDAATLDRMIEVRRAALRGWLDDPTGAPIGIRNSSPGWQRTLRSFADDAP